VSFSRQVAAGIDVVRGYGIGAEFVARNHALIDAYINARLNWDLVNRWLGVRVDLIGAALLSLAVGDLIAVRLRARRDPSLAERR
jgi:hypothetical protein